MDQSEGDSLGTWSIVSPLASPKGYIHEGQEGRGHYVTVPPRYLLPLYSSRSLEALEHRDMLTHLGNNCSTMAYIPLVWVSLLVKGEQQVQTGPMTFPRSPSCLMREQKWASRCSSALAHHRVKSSRRE